MSHDAVEIGSVSAGLCAANLLGAGEAELALFNSADRTAPIAYIDVCHLTSWLLKGVSVGMAQH